MKELVIKKCNKCGSIIIPFKDCNCENCGIICCNEQMQIIKVNDNIDKLNKHLPIYEIVEDEICVKVNHPMEKDHFIEFIALTTDTKTYVEKLYPEMDAVVRFKYLKGANIYAYCNKHGLWKIKVEK